jgi:hypothetical protein
MEKRCIVWESQCLPSPSTLAVMNTFFLSSRYGRLIDLSLGIVTVMSEALSATQTNGAEFA